MFKELNSIMSLMKNAGELKNKMGELKSNLSSIRETGSSSNNLVTVEVNGENRLLSCRIDPKLMALENCNLLEMQIVEATNNALAKVQTAAADQMLQLTGGVNFPGMTEMMSKLTN
jgi:hypothetical protein